MKKLRNYALLGFMGLMGTLTIGATSAETTVTHYPDSNIQYILNGSELFTGVGTITITNGDDTITILDRNLGSVSSSNECLLDFSNICSPGYEAFGFSYEDECIFYYGSRNFNTSICTQNLSGYADADACVNAINSSYGSVVSAQQHCELFSYGYYFQWGNNYGFNSNNTMNTSNQLVDTLSSGFYYDPSQQQYYSSSTFIIDNTNRMNNNLVDLRGGSTDDSISGFSGDNWKVTNATERQGPCPEGFHIPSISEWSKLSLGMGIRLQSLTTNFSLPKAGIMFNEMVVYTGSAAYLWSSSPYGISDSSAAVGFLYDGSVSLDGGYRGYGLPIRCFYNSYDVYTKVLDYDVSFWDDETEFCSGKVVQGEVISGELLECVQENMLKDGYIFDGWYENGATISFDLGESVIKNMVLYAHWTKKQEPINQGGSNHGGGSTLRKDNCPNGDYSDSYYDGTCGKNPNNMSSGTEGKGSIDDNKNSSSQSSSEGQSNNELQTAYEFAYENKITTMDSIEKADMEGGLTRIAMAKMLSKYAINVLGKKPANTIVPKFSDITEELNAEYDYGVSLAYQLGIMGINMPENKFRPFDKVTRAEFGTALSRMLFGIADGEEAYYTTHLAKLKAEGIITNDDPTLQELRGYVMLMLMRSKK